MDTYFAELIKLLGGAARYVFLFRFRKEPFGSFYYDKNEEKKSRDDTYNWVIGIVIIVAVIFSIKLLV